MLAPPTRITDATRLAPTDCSSTESGYRAAETSSASSPTPSTPCSRGSKQQVAEQQRFAANASHEPAHPLADHADTSRRGPQRSERRHRRTRRPPSRRQHPSDRSAPRHCSSSAAPTNGPSPQNTPTCPSIAEEATERSSPRRTTRPHHRDLRRSASRPSARHALLLQLTTNLVQNAIVHNLPEQGTVWVTTSVHPKSAVLAVENTGEKLDPTASRHALPSRFFAAPNAYAPTMQASASAWQSSTASPSTRRNPHPHPPGRGRPPRRRFNYPPRQSAHRRMTIMGIAVVTLVRR